MVIRNLEKQFIVIGKQPGEGEAEQFLCRLDGEREGAEYRIVRLPLSRAGAELVSWLQEQKNRESFSDFSDYFSDQDFLYIVMRLGDGIRLEEKLRRERCSLAERLKIAEQLVTGMILKEEPPFFFSAAMDSRLIRVTPAMEVGFDYDLSGIEDYREADFALGQRRLGQVLGQLFEKELKLSALPDMERLIYGLGHGQYGGLLDIYRELAPIVKEWSAKEETALKPQSLAFRLWERLKSLARLGKKLAMAGLLALALGYLILSVYSFFKEPGIKDNFNQIGSLTITPAETTGAAESRADAKEETA